MRGKISSESLFLVTWSAAILGASLLQVYAPRNSLNSAAGLLRVVEKPRFGLTEPADTLVFLMLAATAGATLLTGWLKGVRSRSLFSLDYEPARLANVFGFTAVGYGTIILFFPLAEGLVVNKDPVSVLPVALLILGVFLPPALNNLLQRDQINLLSWVIGVSLCLFVATGIYQTSSLLYDGYHYRFLANDLASVASGNFPLGGFVSQYSTLIPYLVAPLIVALPLDALTTVTLVTFVMQLTALAIAVRFVWALALRLEIRLLSIVLLGAYAVRVRGYHQYFPARIILPLIAFMAVWHVIRKGEKERSFASVGLILGSVIPILVLNNPDHGIPAAISVSAAVAVTASLSKRSIWTLVKGSVVGLVASLSTVYGLIRIVAGSVNFGDSFKFSQAYGTTGFMREPMALFEPSAVLFPLGLITVALGFVNRQGSMDAQGKARTFILITMGLFQTLTLAYPLGRSFGSTFSVSLFPSIICLCLILDHALGRSQSGFQGASVIGTKMRIWMVYFAAMALALVAGRVLPGFLIPTKESSEVDAVTEYMEQTSFLEIPQSVMDDLSGQLLLWSPFIELSLGIDSLLISNDPASVTLIAELSERQCERLAGTAGRVVMDDRTASRLVGVRTCATDWAERGMEVVAGTEFILLGEKS